MRIRALTALLVLAPLSSAGTIYVDANLASGANNGLTWADAHQSPSGLQTALAAAVAGDQIWVRAGAYKPTPTASRTVSFQLRNGIELYGGFLGGETAISERPPFGTAQSFLLGDLNGDDAGALYGDNSLHVIDAGGTNATAVLDGFTVTGGNANITGPNQDRGGGILCIGGASPTVRNCRFLRNRCTFSGGAGYASNSSPAFTNCSFESNFGGQHGGAFQCTSNVLARFDRCVFSQNAAQRGGALELFAFCTVTVTNCLFVDNVATAVAGGAIYDLGSNPVLRDSTFVGNVATLNDAGGLQSTSSTPVIENCIFWANSDVNGAMGTVNQIDSELAASVSYTCVMGGYPGAGNSAANPQFANLESRDLRLTAESPCVDAGNNSAVPPGTTIDLSGSPRFTDEPTVADTGAGTAPIVDMGCYEFARPFAVAAYCFGDGTGTICPCGNAAPFSSGTGCLNSRGTGGRLLSSGSARIGTDTFVLLGSGMTNSECVYFQGTAQAHGGLGTVFGDGLLCTGDVLVRLGTKFNVGGASQYPAAGDQSVSISGGVTFAGNVREYQVWYHEPAPLCSPETFSLTSALQVTWAW